MSQADFLPTIEASLLRRQLMSMVRRLRRQGSMDVLPFGLLTILGAIDRAGGDITPTELARRENLRSSNLASALRELDASGLIRRTQDPDDGRRVRVGLSEAGEAALRRNRQLRDGWLQQALQGLSAEERDTLLRAGALLERLAASEPTPIKEQA
ncbi:MarR family winged helix-turn-helix transcriptional regulator [Chromobacterium violaceum]|uniref:Homoprotocatechuate degradation operon regulator, HpaR n=1 Tax=Chromobacterium violaceum TaxID=536 RepID=A0AAX2MGG6_CHRVL|nr:MarR family transcriptional regulator [Chromobacterium violaceum]OLZ77744.1 MarR family transcriptional regulator [Chromobacterium violaceum]STB69597.1 homoprotocatechuate degradation operon regulator, HpaR [Chromobacterium violaceum]SUY93137.1 homoprotocatechuate degradation operon regulator, HpaR [Chromobacterium violaceum]